MFTAQQTLDGRPAFYAALKGRVAAAGRSPMSSRSCRESCRSSPIPRPRPKRWSRVHGADLPGLRAAAAIADAGGGSDRALPGCPAAAAPPMRRDPAATKSRFQLVADLARRESLTVRQLIARLGGGRGHRTFAGTPSRWPTRWSCGSPRAQPTGSTSCRRTCPAGLEDFVDPVVPILQERGLFRTEYTGRTLREHYGLQRPAGVFTRSSGAQVAV